MTGKQRMLKTLSFAEPDRPPHFEVMFELEYEAFGLRFPDRHSWGNLSRGEKDAQVGQCMTIYEKIVERFGWDALLVFWPWSDADGIVAAKKTFGEDLLIGSVVGATTWAIEGVSDWVQFSLDLLERPEVIHEAARQKSAQAIAKINELAAAEPDFLHIVNDIAFNAGPFIAPDQIKEFIIPYLAEQVAHIKSLGIIPFIHTDGNIMTFLEEYIGTGAACYQSVDPQAGMDLAVVKEQAYGRMALMGNVQCSLLQDGPPEAIYQSARYCLEHGTPGGGYIYGTSNTIFPGMPLENYEYMLAIYRDFCAGLPRKED